MSESLEIAEAKAPAKRRRSRKSDLKTSTSTQTVGSITAEVTTIEPPPQPQRPPFVMICVPSGATWVSRTATAVAGLATFSALNGVQIGIINLEGSMITKQRNDLVEMCRKNKADYMLDIDSDMSMPPDSLLELLKHNKEIVGATYNKKVPPFETLGRLRGDKPSEEELSKGGLRLADQMPGGFMLIKMSVFDKIKFPYYYECYQFPGESGVEAFKNMMRDYFSVVADEAVLATIEGSPLGNWLNAVHKIESQNKWDFFSEDLSFVRKCIKAGIDVWCDLGLTFRMVHHGTSSIECRSPQNAPSESVVVNAVM